MDTGMSDAVEAVLAKHRGRWTLAHDTGTGHWFAIRCPDPATEITVHAPTLGELDRKLDAEAKEATR